jgi:hypothetical protein
VRVEEEDEPMAIEEIPEAPKQTGDDSDDALFVESDSDDDFFQTQQTPASKRRRGKRMGDVEQEQLQDGQDEDDGNDDKKKLGLKTRYDGFAIYGRIVYLSIKRRGGPAALKSPDGQVTMENWVSTQVAREMGIDMDD